MVTRWNVRRGAAPTPIPVLTESQRLPVLRPTASPLRSVRRRELHTDIKTSHRNPQSLGMILLVLTVVSSGSF